MSRIDILLATYNGAPFLREQLDSLECQTHTDWRLLVRDDGSSDDTLQIVTSFADQSDHEVKIIEDGRTGLGASLNFAALLEASDAPYFAFCDQDDVWLPHKLEIMLNAIRRAETRNEEGMPVLAFSDLRVVAQDLTTIDHSFWDLSGIGVEDKNLSLDQIMVRNCVTGCASQGNAALRRAALPIPDDARMHDWWLALTAVGLGCCVPVPEATILYRQHGGNVVGALDSRSSAMLRSAFSRPGFYWDKACAARDNSQVQARAFAKRFGSRIDQDAAAMMAEYGDLAQKSWLERKTFLLRNRIGQGSFLFRLALAVVS